MILLIPNINVPSGYEYITGYVNGADTIFIADTIINGLCLCSCEESQNNTYEVAMTFYDKDGNILLSTLVTVTQEPNVFITDRTQADVDYAKRLTPSQRANLAEDLKGCLNVSDIDRTSANCDTLSILDDETLTTSGVPEFPDNDFFQTYLLDNADIVQETGFILSTTPETPSTPMNTWDKWNKLEQILWDNFDIRTSRFKYYGPELQMRGNTLAYPFIYTYNGKIYTSTFEQWFNFPLTILNGDNIENSLLEIQDMLGYEYIQTNIIRTVDGSDTIRTVDGTNDIRKVDG